MSRTPAAASTAPRDIALLEAQSDEDAGEDLPDAIFAGLIVEESGEQDSMLDVWMSHGDSVGDLPPGFVATARSSSGALAAMGDARGRYRHPVPPRGGATPPRAQALLENFLYRRLRLRAHLDLRRLHRGSGGAHPRTGGRRAA